MLTVCALLTVFMPTALAQNHEWAGVTVQNENGDGIGLSEAAGSDGWKIWLCDMLWTISGYGMVSSVYNLLTYNPLTDTYTTMSDNEVAGPAGISTLISDKVNNTFQSIGYLLLFLYAMLDMIEKVQAEMFTIEHFLRFMLKVMIGFLLIINLHAMLKGAMDFGIGVMKDLSNTSADNANVIVNTYMYNQAKDIEKANVIGKISLTMRFLVPYLFAIIAKLVVIFTTLGRLIEIGVRAMLSPIAMANLVGRGMDSPGMRYFKKFIALALHAAVIVAILMIAGQLRGTDIIPMDGFFKSIIISLSSCALIIQCGSWANDIVGV